MRQADHGLAGQDEALRLGQGERPVEVRARDVLDRLGDQERGPRLEQLVDFPQESGQVAHLVQHGERQGEIEAAVPSSQADGVLGGFVGLDPVCQAGLGRSPAEHSKHAGLHVHADHFAAGTDHLGHGQAEETHRAADVQDCHAGPDVGRQDLVRVVQELPEPVGQEVARPHGTNVLSHVSSRRR